MIESTIAVVIPVFNRARTVLDTLVSIIQQTRLPGTIIVVDDGSSDGTYDAIKGWQQLHNNDLSLRLIRTDNRGAGAARNVGLLQAGGASWIAFLDSDDVWPTDFVERAIGILDRAPNAIAATADRLLEWADGLQRFDPMSGIVDNPTRWLFFHGGGIASATVFRTNAVRRLGGFPEALKTGQDSALFLPLSLEGDWLHVPGAPVRHRIGYSAGIGEQGNLSSHFPDGQRMWAEIHEDFVISGKGAAVLKENEYAPMLSKYWYLAGRELLRHGRTDEAKSCFRKATKWRFRWKAWLKLIMLVMLRRNISMMLVFV